MTKHRKPTKALRFVSKRKYSASNNHEATLFPPTTRQYRAALALMPSYKLSSDGNKWFLKSWMDGQKP